METARERKRALRAVMRPVWARLPPQELHGIGLDMAAYLAQDPLWRVSRTVFLFWGVPGETDTAPLVRLSLAADKTVCLPRITKAFSPGGAQERRAGEMEAVPLYAEAELLPGAYGIPEPPASRGPVLPAALDLILLPCLAAEASGARLGKGGGFYDRFLARCPAPTVLLCPQAALVPDGTIPLEPWDKKADRVLTENGFLCPRAQ